VPVLLPLKPMAYFEIVAHRGITEEEPENTLPAFQRAIELGADAIELDVRLTSDHVPVVYHYYYLHLNTSAPGAIFEYTFDQLQEVRVRSRTTTDADNDEPALKTVTELNIPRICTDKFQQALSFRRRAFRF
jgi:glycerophosphoryl diester phosphodiesterase